MNVSRFVPRVTILVLGAIAAAMLIRHALASTPPTVRRVPAQTTPSAQPQSSGNRQGSDGRDFDWQRLIGELSHSMEARPMPTTRPIRPIRPDPEYHPVPEYHPIPNAPWRPLPPPVHVRPNTTPMVIPEYVQPEIASPEFVEPTTPTNVVPKPNVIKIAVQVPKQSSPLEGRVTELGMREAQVYAKKLADIIDKRLTAAIGALQQSGIETNVMQNQADNVRQMMTKGSRLKDMEQTLKSLLEGDTSRYPRKILDEFRQLAQWIAVRDAFLAVAAAPPRVRRGAIPVAAIPCGVIWILYDPNLAAGTALFVNDFILVVGTGGSGEFWLDRQCAAAALGLPVAPGEPVPDITEDEVTALSAGTVIQQPKDVGGEVNYVLNSRYPYTIQPGHRQSLPADRAWTIEFDRGNSQGTARYSLERGVYEFRVVKERWDLVHLRFDITIDNREGKQDFQFVAGDKVMTVKAGEQQTQGSTDPLIVKFDRGEGPEQAATKNLNKSGTYKVAVNTDTNLLDLYATSESQPPQAATQ